MSIGNFFKKVGTDLEKFFAVVVTAGEDAEPIVDALDPAIAPVYNMMVAAGAKIEAVAQAVPTAGLTDEQKVASIVQAIEPTILATAEARGLPAPTAAQINAYVTAGLASLDAFSGLFGGAPAPPAPATPASAPIAVVPAVVQVAAVPLATVHAPLAPA